MNILIENRRRRLVQAKLASLKRRTGNYFQIIDMDDGTKLPVELDSDILTKSLIKFFETMIHENHKRAEAKILISNHYSNCTGINKLTPLGVDFMNAVIAILAEELTNKQETQNAS